MLTWSRPRRSHEGFTPPHSRRDPTMAQMTSSHVPALDVVCMFFGSGRRGPKAVLHAVPGAKARGVVHHGLVNSGSVFPRHHLPPSWCHP